MIKFKDFLKYKRCIIISLLAVVLVLIGIMFSIYEIENHKINVNESSVIELMKLHNIGEVYANRIVQLKPSDGYDNLNEMLNIIEYPKQTKRKVFKKYNENKISFK